uniref:Uncharacterized protein n=1 Tax=Chromera velia CCMP2878 TaxID=1169474 RepID=A0A0G4FWV9_9ALVE|eukprot:Cvel_3830.t1-p1 / transcript=Cvel_3830.t1 / gene=Cvel_3830 / organism=Chromera_velia_CCMP2878 / gene_product=hypothetical protein / transcript_product=hypothetical protein / location=Cvel_scaffold162:12057-12605(+) / protein_length=183 / sequence_SO=supercontig / SO=protein_coding / is_pseudo=false
MRERKSAVSFLTVALFVVFLSMAEAAVRRTHSEGAQGPSRVLAALPASRVAFVAPSVGTTGFPRHRQFHQVRRLQRLRLNAGKKEWFGMNDVKVVKRSDEDIAAFHEKERERWRTVYNEVYKETPQDFYPGDRIQIIDDDSEYFGQQGVVLHYLFDDGYMSCQTTKCSYPLTVLLDDKDEVAE